MTATVTVVTVTYGDRWDQLSQVLDALAMLDGSDAIKTVVVVDNGSSVATKQGLAARPDLDVVVLAANEGSAAGFAAGIERAVTHGTQFLWLLDDDNRPDHGALKELLGAVDEYGDQAAFQALRPAMAPLRRLAAGVPAHAVFGHRNERLLQSLKWRLRRDPAPSPAAERHPLMEWAVYGGFFAPTTAFVAAGLPRVDYVLYADDSDYTHRISTAGWPIRLITEAVIDDVDEGWETVAGRRDGVSPIVAPRVRRPAELRSLYYTVRNSVHFRRNRRVTSVAGYLVNVTLRLGLMGVLCLLSALKAWSPAPLRSYGYYVLATWHGLRGKLGPYAGVDRFVEVAT